MVLVPAHAARGGLRVQSVRFAEGRPRALDRAYRVRGSDHAAARAAAREHRNPHPGVFLIVVTRIAHSAIRVARITASRTGSCGALWPCRISYARPRAGRG